MSELIYEFAPTPIGQILMASNHQALVFLGVYSDLIHHELAWRDCKNLALKMGATLTPTHYSQSSLHAQTLLALRDTNYYLQGFKLPMLLIGTPFQKQVWECMRTLSLGQTCSYSDIAHWIKKPKALRAVGAAVGANPISIFIPCHRVLPKNGQLGNYHWGTTLKQLLLKHEASLLS